VQTAIIAAAIGVLAITAYGDVCTRRIPNALSAAIALLGLVQMILAADPLAAARTLGAGAIVFTGAFFLFRRGLFGGGDVKLLAAMALLIGHEDLFRFLFLMSVCGGTLALAIIARDKLRQQQEHPPGLAPAAGCLAASARSTVPYGVAIAAAGVITLILKTPFAT
jgi:prepilin peptidase CpaA